MQRSYLHIIDEKGLERFKNFKLLREPQVVYLLEGSVILSPLQISLSAILVLREILLSLGWFHTSEDHDPYFSSFEFTEGEQSYKVEA